MADTPIEVGGVTVVPGDIIFADTTGAAVIPAEKLEEVLTLARQIKDMAAMVAENIRNEDPEQVLTAGSQEI